jgi:hypothetical protein
MKIVRSPALIAAALLVAHGSAAADPGYYVVTAYPNEGQRTLDSRYWTTKFPGIPEIIWPELGFGYNVTGRWYTEIFASWIDSSHISSHISSWNWQNTYLLTQGEYPLDVAVYTQLIRRKGNEWVVEIGPVLQTDVGRTQLNFNVFLDRPLKTNRPEPTTLKYQWQVRHRWQPALHFGLQGFGELGTWNHWSPREQQSHRAGPALFGKFDLEAGQGFHWQVAYLRGKIYGLDGYMVSARAYVTF